MERPILDRALSDNPSQLLRNPVTGNWIDAVSLDFRRYVQRGGKLDGPAWHVHHAPAHDRCNLCHPL